MKRLSINIFAVQDLYRHFEIDRIGFIRGDSDPADSLTNVHGNKALRHIINGKCKTEVVEWIERENRHNEAGRKCKESKN